MGRPVAPFRYIISRNPHAYAGAKIALVFYGRRIVRLGAYHVVLLAQSRPVTSLFHTYILPSLSDGAVFLATDIWKAADLRPFPAHSTVRKDFRWPVFGNSHPDAGSPKMLRYWRVGGIFPAPQHERYAPGKEAPLGIRPRRYIPFFAGI